MTNDKPAPPPPLRLPTNSVDRTAEKVGYFPNLEAWPRDKAGPPPSRDNIIAARALLGGNQSSKRELAVAAYLRPDALKYHTGQVALALQLVRGGSFNPLLNVVNRDLVRKWKLGEVDKVKIKLHRAVEWVILV
jgi:hypothetical protein